MFVSLRMIEGVADPDAVAAGLCDAAGGLPGAGACWIQPTLPGICLSAGQIVWRMEFASEKDALAAPASAHWREQIDPLLSGAQVTGVGYQATRKGPGPGGAGIWRALVFRVMPHGFPDEVRKLEAALLTMPAHVSTIRGWALNTVATCEGPKAYTHVWEQEFDSIEGLTGLYMDHPIHWGWVDGWFDAEMPQYIVDPQLVQTVGAIDGPIIA